MEWERRCTKPSPWCAPFWTGGERVVLAERGESLLDVMFGRNGSEGNLTDTVWAQPAIFALECALTALWASVGIKPDAVIGHSFGELAAAQAAGVFGLEEGLRFVLTRGDALAVAEPGSMVAVFATEARVEETLREHNAAWDGPDLSISVYNGFQQVVSGADGGGGGYRAALRVRRGSGESAQRVAGFSLRLGGTRHGRPGKVLCGYHAIRSVRGPGERRNGPRG